MQKPFRIFRMQDLQEYGTEHTAKADEFASQYNTVAFRDISDNGGSQ